MSLDREEVYQVESKPVVVLMVSDRHHMQGEILTGGAEGTHEQCVDRSCEKMTNMYWGNYRMCLKHCQALCNCPCNTKESSSIC